MTRTVIQIRVSPEEKAQIKEAADRAGVGLSEWMRWASLNITVTESGSAAIFKGAQYSLKGTELEAMADRVEGTAPIEPAKPAISSAKLKFFKKS